jgi:hypothetical protein
MEPECTSKTELELLQEIANSLKQRPRNPIPVGLTWLEGFVPTFITLCTFGGSITFTVIPTIEDGKPIPHYFSSTEVRTFLSLAWLFFVFALGLAGGAAVVLTFRHEAIKNALREEDKAAPWALLTVSAFGLLLQIFTILAFLFLSLVVVAYTPVVGWIVFRFSCAFMVIAIVVWVADVVT